MITPAPPLPVVRTVAWTINAKNYKDILIRTYPTFAQILISPVTTGLKNSLNSNVCEELIDALRQVNELVIWIYKFDHLSLRFIQKNTGSSKEGGVGLDSVT